MKSLDRSPSFHPKPLFRVSAVFRRLDDFCSRPQVRAWAIGGPENVLLVVNPRSPDSLCIANHYAELRHIPPNNFSSSTGTPSKRTTDVDTFREKILCPCSASAKLPIPGRQIDYVVYSSDFPWGIRIDEDIKKFKAAVEKQEQEREKGRRRKRRKSEKPTAKPPRWTTYVTPVASINGLTYLWEPVLANDFYVHPQCNWYARTGVPEQAKEPTLGVLQCHGLRSAWRGGSRSRDATTCCR